MESRRISIGSRLDWSKPHASAATVFPQFAWDGPFVNEAMEKGYFEVVSEPKKCKIYKA